MTPASAAFEQTLAAFDIPAAGLVEIKQKLSAEMELGLRDEEDASVKMLITYVRELSRGDEFGTYLALDLGGTNFRVLLVSLDAGKAAQVTSECHAIPQSLLVVDDGRLLFDYIASKLLEFVKAKRLGKKRITLGFTFSFPCKQYGLTQSFLIKWCKGYKVGGVVNTDVVKQLKDALKRQLAGLAEAYIDVVAVINDTTGSLVACASANQNCRIGLIAGTGFNACYLERLERCDKWPANYTSPKHVIINTEWGSFGDHKSRRSLDKFRNEFDAAIDAHSVNPQNQTYEKMVAGMYVGEQLRRALAKLVAQGHLFASQAGAQLRLALSNAAAAAAASPSHHTEHAQPKLATPNSLDGRHLSLLADDELCGSTSNARSMLTELGLEHSAHVSKAELEFVVKLGAKIIDRSASLCAAGLAALLERIKKPQTTIGFDGSLIKQHPYYLKTVEARCSSLTASQFKASFVQTSDGSGIGAAIVAAALHKERRPLYVVKPGKLYELHFTPKSTQQAAPSDAH